MALQAAEPTPRAQGKSVRREVEVDLVGWNVYVRNSPDQVGAKLDQIHANQQPVLVGLNEAFRSKGRLGGRLKKFRRLWDGRRREAKNNPFFVRGKKKVRVLDTWRMRMGEAWRFKKRKPPRVFRVVLWHLAGKRWTKTATCLAHFPTGGPNGRNSTAWREGARRCVRFAKRHPNAVVTILGDFNATEGQVDHWIAGRINGQVLSAAKVDHLVVRGTNKVAVTPRREPQRLGKAGSDHPALLYRLTYRRR